MTLTFALRTRVLLIVLTLAALGAGLMTFKRVQSSSGSSAPPTPATTASRPSKPTVAASKVTKATASKATKATATKAKASASTPANAAAQKPIAPSARPSGATAKAGAQKPVAPLTRPSAAPAKPAGNELPGAISRALAANKVVVVALYDPKAKIDDTALGEAIAGARLAGTTFVRVDVTKDDVASLHAKYGAVQDPAVLVLRPPGDLIVRIDGFADRDTVAQAAANAVSAS